MLSATIKKPLGAEGGGKGNFPTPVVFQVKAHILQ